MHQQPACQLQTAQSLEAFSRQRSILYRWMPSLQLPLHGPDAMATSSNGRATCKSRHWFFVRDGDESYVIKPIPCVSTRIAWQILVLLSLSDKGTSRPPGEPAAIRNKCSAIQSFMYCIFPITTIFQNCGSCHGENPHERVTSGLHAASGRAEAAPRPLVLVQDPLVGHGIFDSDAVNNKQM
jgi:hypothetical protein